MEFATMTLAEECLSTERGSLVKRDQAGQRGSFFRALLCEIRVNTLREAPFISYANLECTWIATESRVPLGPAALPSLPCTPTPHSRTPHKVRRYHGQVCCELQRRSRFSDRVTDMKRWRVHHWTYSTWPAPGLGFSSLRLAWLAARWCVRALIVWPLVTFCCSLCTSELRWTSRKGQFRGAAPLCRTPDDVDIAKKTEIFLLADLRLSMKWKSFNASQLASCIFAIHYIFSRISRPETPWSLFF